MTLKVGRKMPTAGTSRGTGTARGVWMLWKRRLLIACPPGHPSGWLHRVWKGNPDINLIAWRELIETSHGCQALTNRFLGWLFGPLRPVALAKNGRLFALWFFNSLKPEPISHVTQSISSVRPTLKPVKFLRQTLNIAWSSIPIFNFILGVLFKPTRIQHASFVERETWNKWLGYCQGRK
jgi:hypothetical protein